MSNYIKDGLSPEQRQRLYIPGLYLVVEAGAGFYRIAHREVTAMFTLRKLDRRGRAEVTSNTGNTHTIDYHLSACTCEDSKRHGGERYCKHLAVAEAVAHFCDGRREMEQEAKYAARRETLAGWVTAAQQVAGEMRGR